MTRWVVLLGLLIVVSIVTISFALVPRFYLGTDWQAALPPDVPREAGGTS